MSQPAKKTVELFYDVISPYSWVGFEFLCRARNRWQIDLKFKPFFLGAIMKESGNRPPITVAKKGEYMFHDIERIRSYYQIPFSPPSNVTDFLFNKGSLSAQRLLTLVEMTQSNLTESLSRELWMRAWSRGQDISTNEGLLEALKSVGVSNDQATQLVQGIKDKNVVDQLKKVTQEALDHGAFGAPTILVQDAQNKKHLLFGSDRMEILASILGEKYEGPLTQYAAAKL